MGEQLLEIGGARPARGIDGGTIARGGETFAGRSGRRDA
jgi:hypothetical protein